MRDAVTFRLSPGIRGPEHTGSGYSCVDEENCDVETAFLCGRKVAGNDGVELLACMDRADGDATAKAKTCSEELHLDFTAVSTCFAGQEGQDLKKAAATYFDTKFPDPVGVPTIQINGQTQGNRDYASLITALCATGIQAGACSKDQGVVV